MITSLVFWGSNSALQKILQTRRGGSAGELASYRAFHTTLLKLRAAPSAKVNICANGIPPGAILRHPQCTHFTVLDSIKRKSFKL